MLELFHSGGWLMWPLLACSIVSIAIVLERMWTLRSSKILPPKLVENIINQLSNQHNKIHLPNIAYQSPLGAILVTGLQYRLQGVSVMRSRMEEQGRQVVVKLEKYLNALGTIAAVAPLLGLLGTVIGMIHVFSALNLDHTGNTEALAGGIAQALLTTAFGLMIAIPSLMFHRHFQRKVDELANKMEFESVSLIEKLKENVGK